MALKNLFGWSSKAADKAPSACGSACGAGDKPAEPSSALRGRRPQAHRLRECLRRWQQEVSARAPAGQPAGAHFPRDGVCSAVWEMRPLLKKQAIRR